MLRAVLLRGEQALRRAWTRVRGARNRVQARASPLGLDKRLRRRPDEREVAELEQEEIRRGVHAAERPVKVERGRAGRPLCALRDDDLERVAGDDVLLSGRDRTLVRLPRRMPPAWARAAAGAGEFDVRDVQLRAQLDRIAAQPLRRSRHVIEAEHRLDDDEPALGKLWPVRRERHCRLERRSEVGAEGPHHRFSEALRLLEGDEAAAVPDKRVTPEPPALDRLEQEARRTQGTQADVCPERGDQVCGYGGRGLHLQTKETLAGLGSGTGCVQALVREQAPAPLEAPGPPRAERGAHRLKA